VARILLEVSLAILITAYSLRAFPGPAHSSSVPTRRILHLKYKQRHFNTEMEPCVVLGDVGGHHRVIMKSSFVFLLVYTAIYGLVVRVPGYTTKTYSVSCEVRTEFIYVM
jgi:hypothetical protein